MNSWSDDRENLEGYILGLAPHSEEGALSGGTNSDLHIQKFVHRESKLLLRHLYPLAFLWNSSALI